MRRLASIVVGLCAVGAVSAAVWWGLSRSRSGPPAAEVDRTEQRVTGVEGKPVRARYVIRNTGGADLILGEVSSSCGCGSAKLSTRVVAPGGTADLDVEGTPPASGVRRVTLRVPTNASAEPLALSFVMEGTDEPPYLLMNSGPIHFGDLKGSPAPATLGLQTQEKEGDPWIDEVRVSEPFLKVSGGMVHANPNGSGIVLREYEYKVTLDPKHAKAFQAEVVLRSRAGETIARVPVDATVEPSVSAVPSKLFTTLEAGEPTPKFLVVVRARDGVAGLNVQPTEATARAFDVRRVATAAESATVEIQPRVRPGGTYSGEVVLTTGIGDAPTLSIPVRILANASATN